MNKYVKDDTGKIVFEGEVIIPQKERQDLFNPTHDFPGYCEKCNTGIDEGIWYYGPWGAGWHCDSCYGEHFQEANIILYGTY